MRFGIDAGSGKLVPSGETPAAGAPSVFALSECVFGVLAMESEPVDPRL